MSRRLASRSLTRRSIVGLGFGLTVGSLLAACGQAAQPTSAPAPAKPTEAPKPAAAAPTTAPAAAPTPAPPAGPTTARPAAPTTAPAAAPTTAPAAAPTQAPAPAATKPSASIKINGNLQIIQSRSFNPIQTTFQHNLLLKEAANRGWPL